MDEGVLILIFFAVALFFIIKSGGSTTVSQKTPEQIKQDEQYKQSGQNGERIVESVLKEQLQDRVIIFNNLTLQDQKKKSFQIDHLIIADNGIWVIETKNWKGRIYGRTESEEWTQYLADIGEYKKYYNPVKQNRKHLEKIRELIGDSVLIFSLIVFTRADIEKIESKTVCTINGLVKKLSTDTGFIMSEFEKEHYKNFVLKCQENCKITEEQHAKKLQQRKERLENGLCPFCGSRLIERKGKYSSFYGCSRYPYCKFKKNK